MTILACYRSSGSSGGSSGGSNNNRPIGSSTATIGGSGSSSHNDPGPAVYILSHTYTRTLLLLCKNVSLHIHSSKHTWLL